jgi:hypothetical protein
LCRTRLVEVDIVDADYDSEIGVVDADYDSEIGVVEADSDSEVSTVVSDDVSDDDVSDDDVSEASDDVSGESDNVSEASTDVSEDTAFDSEETDFDSGETDFDSEASIDIEFTDNEEDEDETGEDETGEDETGEDGGLHFELDREDNRHLASVEFITDKIITDGFTIVDVVSVCLKRFSHSDPRYTDSHCRSICKRFRKTVDTCDIETLNEQEQRTFMTREDIRY